MPESPLRGVCDSCGKTYRIPSADRSYDCKECDGSVSAVQKKAAATTKPLMSAREEREHKRTARRSRARQSATGWVMLAVLLGALGLGMGGYQMGWFSTILGAEGDPRMKEADIGKVNQAFVEAWQAGDMQGMSSFHHPTGRSGFEKRLQVIAEHRDWSGAWPTVETQTANDRENAVDGSKTASSLCAFGDSTIFCRWQFDEGVERWFLFDFWIKPTLIEERVEAYRKAWETSDPVALRPFFREEKADAMQTLVEAQVAKQGWSAGHPKLKRAVISGEERALDNLSARIGGGTVDSVFDSPQGELLVRWKFRQEADLWLVTGFKFP